MQKKLADDKVKIVKRTGEPFPLIEFPTDYSMKESKTFKINQLGNQANQFRYDPNNHQGFINTTTYKLDKEIIMTLNGITIHQGDFDARPDG